MQVHSEVHLPAMFLWDGENSRTILVARVLPMVQVRILCKNWHLCRLCWEDCARKNSHVPTSPAVATAIARLLKTDMGE